MRDDDDQDEMLEGEYMTLDEDEADVEDTPDGAKISKLV